MSKVLVVSGHPRTGDDSVANKTILEELASLMPGVEIDHLDELYPNYVFDVEAEQSKLAAVDVIVLQYPLWWYGWPSLLQKWLEDVFVRGFSHGSTGTALKAKKLVVSLTTGAPESYYCAQPGGIDRFLAPVKATSALTGMEFAGSLPLFGVSYANRTDEAAHADMVARSREHAARLAEFVSAL
ncbi:MAG: NAD(P)H-dependent oxidoreductase [Actinomyces bouchesdurhonensis]|uniref:NAD(P)H-dependent oxidoreductase n=1 Tax=Actinomyces bouchesdurhonensis TaxID=1852361 RepID=A0A929RNM9_9ACTO|nr:NAD(P)H-dependent oxidoreductase [Actinomyces bouchesdurhonensis]